MANSKILAARLQAAKGGVRKSAAICHGSRSLEAAQHASGQNLFDKQPLAQQRPGLGWKHLGSWKVDVWGTRDASPATLVVAIAWSCRSACFWALVGRGQGGCSLEEVENWFLSLCACRFQLGALRRSRATESGQVAKLGKGCPFFARIDDELYAAVPHYTRAEASSSASSLHQQ